MISTVIGLISTILIPPVSEKLISKIDAAPQPILLEKQEMSVKEKISYYSKNYEIDDEIPLSIAKAESNYLNICNQDKGCTGGIGIFQIVQTTFDEQCKGSPYIIDDNIKCGIKMIKAGEYWRWEPSMNVWLYGISTTTRNNLLYVCNCVTGLRSFGVEIPYNTNAEDLQPNTTPHVGAILLFKYNNNIYHAALIIKMTAKYMIVKETNFKKCHKTIRKVYYNDKFIRGFYDIST